MHHGIVRGLLEPSLALAVLSTDGTDVEIDFDIDTGFTEEMTLPPDIIDQLNLPTYRQLSLAMADGTVYDGTTYVGRLNWHGRIRSVEVISVDVDPLVGMRLLAGSNLSIDAELGGAVTITELPAR
jgi:clan AA aspartic protease